MSLSGILGRGLRQAMLSPKWKTLSTEAAPSPTAGAFDTLAVTKHDNFVTEVELNRPDKLNAMNGTLWREMRLAFDQLAEDPDCRCIVLSGSGRMFTAGLDFSDVSTLASTIMGENDVARKSKALHKLITSFQGSITALEKCPKPVVAAVHNACVGGGVNIITAADVRYCTQDAWFQIKEVALGIAADVGVLQRLPKQVGSDSLVRELAFTARKMYADEALRCGLVSRVFADKPSMMAAVRELAANIASQSPVAVQGTKVNLNYSRDHTVDEGLQFQATWNMSMLQSEDVVKAITALMDKTSKGATFSKL